MAFQRNNFATTKNQISQIYQLAKQVLVVDSSPISVKRIASEIIDLNHDYLGAARDLIEMERLLDGQEPDIILINSHIHGEFSGFQIAKIMKLEYDIPFYMMCSGNDGITQKWLAELNPDGLIYLSNSSQSLTQQLSEILG